MSPRTDCRYCGSTREDNGNCTKHADDDRLPTQCVGQWALDKHRIIKRYIDATWAARAQFLHPQGRGGAAYVDLFAGPGRIRVRNTGEIQDGSPLIALHHAEAPFTRLVFCDLDADNVRALRARTAGSSERTAVIQGDCNAAIDQIAAQIPEKGLNIALIDPFGLKALKFSTLSRLAQFPRMDLIIHFPSGDIKRNLVQNDSYIPWLSEAMGTDQWASRITSKLDVAGMLEVFKKQLSTLGYLSQHVRSELIKNDQNTPLYYLVYASKNPLGDKIWKSIIKNGRGGQRDFGFD